MELASPMSQRMLKSLRNTPDDTVVLQASIERLERNLVNHVADIRGHLIEMEDRLLAALAASGEGGLVRKPTVSSNIGGVDGDSPGGDSREERIRSTVRRQQTALRKLRAAPELENLQRHASGASVLSALGNSPLSASIGPCSGADGSGNSDMHDKDRDHATATVPVASMVNFTLNSLWQHSMDTGEVALAISIMPDDDITNYESVARYQSQDDNIPHESGRCMLRPSSSRRLAWDLIGVCFILYDVVTIPFFLAFNPRDTEFTVFMFWLVLIFWTMDVALSFSTGIYSNGVEEMRRSKVAVSYLRSWFFLDLLVVGVDWVVVILARVQRQQGISMARVSKTVRTIRIIRSLRLLRILKVKRLMEYIQDHITSELVQVMLKMANLMLAVLLINHNVACFWYFIGDGIDGKDIDGWVALGDFNDEDNMHSYLTALHWSLTQFTTGSMEIHAGTTAERAYSVVVLVFALMVFSFFLSSITAAMNQLRNLTNAFDNKFAVLRRYLKFNNVPAALTIRILRGVQHKLSSEKREIHESDVKLLQVVSSTLYNELKQFLHQPKIARHPFFRIYADLDKLAIQELCASALSSANLTASEVLFSQRASDGQMFFGSKGMLKYTHGQPLMSTQAEDVPRTMSPSSKTSSLGTSKVWSSLSALTSGRGANRPSHERAMQLHPGDWCCEPAIWTRWVHMGSMRATTNAEVLTLSAADFAVNVGAHQHLSAAVLDYARKYLIMLNEISARHDLCDMPTAEVYRCEELALEAFGDIIKTKELRRSGRSSTIMSPSVAQAALRTHFRSGGRHGTISSLGSSSSRPELHATNSQGSHRLGAETGSFAVQVFENDRAISYEI